MNIKDRAQEITLRLDIAGTKMCCVSHDAFVAHVKPHYFRIRWLLGNGRLDDAATALEALEEFCEVLEASK